MTQKGLGMTVIVETDGRLAGIFTDGDLRRALTRAWTCARPASTRS